MKVYFLSFIVALLVIQAIDAYPPRNENVADCPDCSQYDDGTTLPDINSCSKYYLCVNGRSLPQHCAPGYHYDVIRGHCNQASLVNCALNSLGQKVLDEVLDWQLLRDLSQLNEPCTSSPPPPTPCTTTTTCTTTTPCTTTTTCTTTKAPCTEKTPPPPPATKAPCTERTPPPPPATKAPCTKKTPPPRPATKAPCTEKTPPATKAPCTEKTPPATKAPCTVKTPPPTKAPCTEKTPPPTKAPCTRRTPHPTKAPCTTTTTCTTTTPCTTTTTCTPPPCAEETAAPTNNNLRYYSSSRDCLFLPEGTILLDPHHCRRYFTCVNRRTRRTVCQIGYWYDKAYLKCRPRELVTNCLACRN